jgi:tRNA (cmo5U34)-methyltransferase
MTADSSINLWRNAEHALDYLQKRDSIPHRAEGYAAMLEVVPAHMDRVLDLGTGDGNVLALVLAARPGAAGVGLDFQDEMLDRARQRFSGVDAVEIRRHDMDDPLPIELGEFDLVVSSFAIHHLVPDRQRALYGEIFDRLRPGGVFANVEHVASSTPARHLEFLSAIGYGPDGDDPSNKLVPVASHLAWLDGFGYADSECLWKWRELAVVTGSKPM